jgi:hypothetical protein
MKGADIRARDLRSAAAGTILDRRCGKPPKRQITSDFQNDVSSQQFLIIKNIPLPFSPKSAA